MKIWTVTLALAAFGFLMTNCGDKKGKPQKASQNIDTLLMKYPDSIPLLLKHGNYYFDKYNFNKALSSAAKAFRLDSNNIDARILFADVLNNRPDRTIEEVVTAQRHFTYIVAKQPKNVRALVSLASTYSLMQDFDMSFKYINDALRIDPRYRDAYILKGTNYLQLNKIPLAKSSYETAVQQDPDFYEAYVALGNLYQKEDNPICIEYYTTAATIAPKDLNVLYLQAYALQYFGKSEEALQKYREMYVIDDSFAMAQFQQGFIKQFYQNDIDSAIIFYDRALLQEPTFVEAWHNLGMCYEDKKDKSQALQAYSKALKYNPEFQKSRDAADKLR
ncbi:MAG: tetratricopeptide repeat protein [Bacteroidota bacterium]